MPSKLTFTSINGDDHNISDAQWKQVLIWAASVYEGGEDACDNVQVQVTLYGEADAAKLYEEETTDDAYRFASEELQGAKLCGCWYEWGDAYGFSFYLFRKADGSLICESEI